MTGMQQLYLLAWFEKHKRGATTSVTAPDMQ